MINTTEDEEIAGDIYNLIGLAQVLYLSMALINKDDTIKTNPYCKLKSISS